MVTPTNYSACVRTRIELEALNISRDIIFVVNVQPVKTAKMFNLENFRLYSICWPLPSNQSFYRQIASYVRGVRDPRVNQ